MILENFVHWETFYSRIDPSNPKRLNISSGTLEFGDYGASEKSRLKSWTSLWSKFPPTLHPSGGWGEGDGNKYNKELVQEAARGKQEL